MKRMYIVTVICLSFALAAVSLSAQEQKPAQPKPAVGPSQALLDVWNYVGHKIIACDGTQTASRRGSQTRRL